MFKHFSKTLVLLLSIGFLSGCSPTVVELKKGDCLDLPDGVFNDSSFSYEGLSTISCAQPHNAEVVDTLVLADKQYPGSEMIMQRTEEFCPESFNSYIGKDSKDSLLDLVPLSPTEESWRRANDRTIICIAFSQHERIPKSFKNSRR